MELFKILLFLNLAFFVQSDCRDCMPISASRDEDVHLRCFEPNLHTQDCYRVKWVKYMSDGDTPKVILTWPKKSSNLHDDDRVKELADEDKQSKNLLLAKVQKSDEGLYSCEVFRGWECIVSKNFSLRVTDCQIKVKNASLGSTVTLDCSEASPQNLSWSVLIGGNPVPLSTERFQRNGTMLSLSSALASDSKWYSCNYTHGDIQRCVDIRLLVQGSSRAFTTTPVPDIATAQSGGEFSTTVLTVSVTLVIAVMCAVVGAVLHYKYKNKKAPQQTPEYQDFSEYDVAYATVNDFSPSDV